MHLKKTRVIIASILLIAALALALRGRIVWEELTQLITIYTLPLVTPMPEESTIDLPSCAQPIPPHDAPPVATDTPEQQTEAPIPDKIQVIPTPEMVQTVLVPTPQSKSKPTLYKKKRVTRRRKKEIETDKESATAQPIPSLNIAEPAPTKAETIVQLPVSAPTEALQDVKKIVRVCNKIDVNKLGVKHWTGTYTPTKLEITLNNVPFTIVGNNPVTFETIQEISCADNRITAQYVYEFLNGIRKGSDAIIYTFTDHATPLEMHFSWDTPWHIELSGAQRAE